MSYKLVFDFTCRIEGQEDRIHMVQQRHNEGYGLVIRSEKDDIWERLSGSEAFRLEEKLLDEVEYRTYHNRIEKLDSLSACREMNFELMENNNPNLNHMIGKIWNELGQKENILSTKVIADFRDKAVEHFHPVDGMNGEEIEEMVSYYVQAKIIENNLDAQVENVILSGSRCRGIEKNGSYPVAFHYISLLSENMLDIKHIATLRFKMSVAFVVYKLCDKNRLSTVYIEEFLNKIQEYDFNSNRCKKSGKPESRQSMRVRINGSK